ncbi:DUF3107 domain-containing protein [Enteractinococcus coprophilus]|uniref:Uncharacterized protein DUF3107 n=1 Tax=Enteractinococcus coprophilus TaxID=1027633 RepID=A0A543A047_9MICC|nr:DUF3107 domain-containing protein [Enteractinococcus coprophilus]TQL65963.1 uncharacterized protein DUF3107 [Enteractinococcus coprophilus]
MEIRIGIQNVAREISFQTDMSKDDVTAKVRAAVNDKATLELTDDKGGTIIVPAGVLGYVEIGDATARRVGFIAG